MKTRVRRGFTLPEVLVTVTVVAVLAAVVVPAVTQYATKGDAPATQQDLTEIRNGITSYVADTRLTPTSFYDLVSPSAPGAKGPYLTANLVGTTGAGTFTSGGLGLTLGPSITTSTDGYLVTSVALRSGANTCADLYALDLKIDQGGNTGSTATAAADATAGNLIWTNSGCTATTTAASSANPQLRLAAVGK